MEDVKKTGLLGPPTGYIDMMDASLRHKAEREATVPFEKMPLRPSASGYCARRLAEEFYDFRHGIRREAEIKKPDIMRLLDFGNSVEYHGIRLFQQMDMAAIREALPQLSDLKFVRVAYKQQSLDFFELAPGERIEGSIDLVLLTNNSKGAVDFKSKGDRFFKPRFTKWDATDINLEEMRTVERISDTLFWVEDLEGFLSELDDPFFVDNFVQLNLYACSQFLRDRGIDHASIIQYGKNDSRMREIRFKPSMAVYEYVEAKFRAVQRAIDEHNDPTLVMQEFERGSFRCKYCPWKKHCWGKGK